MSRIGFALWWGGDVGVGFVILVVVVVVVGVGVGLWLLLLHTTPLLEVGSTVVGNYGVGCVDWGPWGARWERWEMG